MAGRAHRESAERVSRCVTALLREQPFFGSLALRLPIRADAGRETLASDGREIRYAPEWVAETDAHVIETAIARVVLACALKHHTRRGERDSERWQRASQLVTHGLLRDAGFTRMNDPDFAAWSPGEAMLADRSHLSLDWLTIEDGGESFAALRALPRAEKEALFAACVARTVKGQLAFEPQARPELEATIARLDIDFAKHVRPTADMLWSRIAKARVLDIARTVFGLAWASARSKYKKPALAEAMEAAFAAGDPPVGVSAAMHAAALAWVPPGFAAFDTGGVEENAVGTASGAAQAPEAGSSDTASAAETGKTPADPPVAEGAVDRPTMAPSDEHPAGSDGNGSETEAAAADGEADPDVAGSDGIAPPAPVNGHDAAPDPMAIPEFLRRVQ